MLCYITLCVVFVGFAFGQDEITTAPPPIESVTEGSNAPEQTKVFIYIYL